MPNDSMSIYTELELQVCFFIYDCVYECGGGLWRFVSLYIACISKLCPEVHSYIYCMYIK